MVELQAETIATGGLNRMAIVTRTGASRAQLLVDVVDL
jgi:hypothetical protein